jgi:hypothetical protein
MPAIRDIESNVSQYDLVEMSSLSFLESLSPLQCSEPGLSAKLPCFATPQLWDLNWITSSSSSVIRMINELIHEQQLE